MLCITFILVPTTLQNDTFYTIKVGERIAIEGFTQIDNFTFLEGIPYTSPHWLYDYGIYYIYRLGGLTAIHISSVILTIVLGSALFFFGYQTSHNRFVTYFVVCGTLMTMILNCTARAQLVTYTLFVIEYGVLYLYCQQKLSRITFLIIMVLISILIVNMHCATWLLFFLIGLPFIVEKLATGRLGNKNYQLSSRIMNISSGQYSALFILLTFFITLLTGFLNPADSTIAFTYLVKTYNGISTSAISEHQALVPITYLAFMIFILQMTYLILFTHCKFYARELLILFGLCMLALVSVRQVAILLLINALIAPRLLTQAFEESCPKRLQFYTEKIVTIKGIIIAFIILVIMCFIFYIQTINEKDTDVYERYDSSYPVKAMDYLTNNIDSQEARIYADYAIGSYVLFRGYHPFIDSRADLYTIEFNSKQDYFTEMINLKSFQRHYDDFFKEFNINYILLAQKDTLNTYIKHDDRYPIIYQDDEFIIYQREAN